MLIYACGQKKQPPEGLNSLYLLYATPEESGYLPLKLFSENDSLFVQYIKNGKQLDKILLEYNHSQKNERGDTIYFFDEIINGQKVGSYQITDEVFYPFSYLNSGITNDPLLKYKSKGKSIKYSIEWYLSKDKRNEYLYGNDKPIFDFLYSIYSNPKSIEKSSFDEIEIDNIWTSKDGNLRIYNKVFDQGGNGLGSDYPLEIVQFRDGNTVSAFGEIAWDYEQRHLENFIYDASFKIYTILLNNKTYYMIDRAMYDGMPMSYKDDEGSYTDGDLLQIYAIENGELIKKKLFNTTKKVIDQIAIEYDDSEFYDKSHDWTKGKKWNLFKYDENTKTIYVPIVDGIKLTDKYLLYQWDGKYLTYKGIEK